MTNYLVQHAIENVWCTPEQDRQYRFKTTRLTRSTGTYRSITVNFEELALPNTVDRFHVYQIGQLDPELLNLVELQSTWLVVSRLCRNYNLLIDLYTIDGLQYPRFESWIMITRNKNILIAVKEQLKINVLDTKDLYIRFYTNAYFSSVRRLSDIQNYIYVYGKHINTLADIEAILTRVSDKVNDPGETYGFINGRYTTTLTNNTIKLNDVVEIVHDTSIKKIMEYKVNELDFFDSILDTKRKYLLVGNYPGNTIDYQDDIDIYLYTKRSDNSDVGIYYHKNAIDSMRMVTHKAWSINATYVEAYQVYNSEIADFNNLYIRLYIRNSGYERALVDEASSIATLYLLEGTDNFKKALLGYDSVVQEWRADYLEQSSYCKIMRIGFTSITPLLVEKAYGYNAVSKLVGDTVQQVDSNTKLFKVPMVARNDGKKIYVWKYNNYGYLTLSNIQQPTIYTYSGNETLPLTGSDVTDTKFVEVIGSLADSNSPNPPRYVCWALGDNVPKVFPKNTSLRFYRCLVTSNGPSFEWEDITNTSYYNKVLNPDNSVSVNWTISTSVFLCLVVNDSAILNGVVNIQPTDGYLQFSINPSNYFNGNTFEIEYPPVGNLEIWVNGNALVEDIDYLVDYPKITIISKRFINGLRTDNNIIQYRGMGVCDVDCQYKNKSDRGWVKYGELSRNKTFNLFNKRNVKFVANGRTFLLNEISNPEYNDTISIFHELNGTPYCITALDVPLFQYLTGDIVSLKQDSESITERINNYMTLKKPESPDPTQTSAGLSKYELYSPFIGAVISGILDGDFDTNLFTSLPSTSTIEAVVTPYLYLLKNDPTQTINNSYLDSQLIVIHPHPNPNVITLTFGQWRFLKRVVDLYTKGKVDISHFISIT